VVIKGVFDHPRVKNERDVLNHFQDRTPYLRSLIDEIEEPLQPPTIALQFLDDGLLNASIKRLNRKEIKYVSRCILEALATLHEDSFVHTGKIDTSKFEDFTNKTTRYQTR
jgi:serine/threonine protein kinase